MRKTNLIFLTVFFLMVALTVSDGIGNQLTSYYALGGLIILGACGIIYSLWRIQRMSGVSWNQTGKDARDRLDRAYQGDLNEEDAYIKQMYMDEQEYERDLYESTEYD